MSPSATPDERLLRIEHEDTITHIRLNRADKRNAISDGLIALLHTTFSELPGVHIDAALLTEGRDPQVAPVLGRVARKRLAFLEQIFADLGYSHAKDRALLATTAYIGLAQLRRSAPDLTPSSRRVRAYVDHAVDALLAE